MIIKEVERRKRMNHELRQIYEDQELVAEQPKPKHGISHKAKGDRRRGRPR